MPVGGRFTFTAFDSSKVGSWVWADINGVFYTWGAMIAAVLGLTGIVYGVTGIILLAPFAFIADIIKERWGVDWMLGSIIALTLLPPLIFVFVLRYNFTVVGPRRQFRYICRWF